MMVFTRPIGLLVNKRPIFHILGYITILICLIIIEKQYNYNSWTRIRIIIFEQLFLNFSLICAFFNKKIAFLSYFIASIAIFPLIVIRLTCSPFIFNQCYIDITTQYFIIIHFLISLPILIYLFSSTTGKKSKT